MVGCHHRLDGHQFEQAPGDGDGQGSLGHCNPWGLKESDMTERPNNNTKGAGYSMLPSRPTSPLGVWGVSAVAE